MKFSINKKRSFTFKSNNDVLHEFKEMTYFDSKLSARLIRCFLITVFTYGIINEFPPTRVLKNSR